MLRIGFGLRGKEQKPVILLLFVSILGYTENCAFLYLQVFIGGSYFGWFVAVCILCESCTGGEKRKRKKKTSFRGELNQKDFAFAKFDSFLLLKR